MALLATKKAAVPDLEALTERKAAALATWRTTDAAYTAAVAEERRVRMVPPGTPLADQIAATRGIPVAEDRRLQAEEARVRAQAACLEADGAWQRAFIAAMDVEGQALFARITAAGEALTDAVQAFERWARGRDAELLHVGPLTITSMHGMSRPRWASAVPPWFVAPEPGGQVSAWQFFVEHVRCEFHW